MVRNGDDAKQVWLLEFGWTSDDVHPAYAWHRVTEDQKADYIVGALSLGEPELDAVDRRDVPVEPGGAGLDADKRRVLLVDHESRWIAARGVHAAARCAALG